MTDDVYAYKSPNRPGWLKLGHTGKGVKREDAARTWLEPGVFLDWWPGGGFVMEQWLHRQLEDAGYERAGHTEWFQLDMRPVYLAVNVGDEAGVEFVTRAVAEKKKQEAAKQRLTEQQVQRELALSQRDAVVYQAQIARESAQQALRFSQPQYERPVPRFPPVIGR